MADIKRCPICGGRTVIFREKGGFRWVHTSKAMTNRILLFAVSLKTNLVMRFAIGTNALNPC